MKKIFDWRTMSIKNRLIVAVNLIMYGIIQTEVEEVNKEKKKNNGKITRKHK